MKYLVGLSLSFLFSINAFALSVVSDLDDTLKVTNVLDLAQAARNALFSKKAFYYVPETLENFRAYTNDLYVLSASPSFLRKNIEDFMEFHQIQTKEVILRDLFRQRESRDYKFRSLRRIFVENPGETFILIGDDTQNDPEVYLKIKKAFPDQVEDIYIRRIKFRPLGFGIKGFFTMFELAMGEYQAGRLSLTDALAVGKDHLLTRDLELVVPKFAFCPRIEGQFSKVNNVALNLVYGQVKRRVTNYCKKRYEQQLLFEKSI